ncbi:hypothetical protein PF008_g33536, partial [Phytophthora fragariae]
RPAAAVSFERQAADVDYDAAFSPARHTAPDSPLRGFGADVTGLTQIKDARSAKQVESMKKIYH